MALSNIGTTFSAMRNVYLLYRSAETLLSTCSIAFQRGRAPEPGVESCPPQRRGSGIVRLRIFAIRSPCFLLGAVGGPGGCRWRSRERGGFGRPFRIRVA